MTSEILREIVFTLDTRGCLTHVSPMGQELVGYSAQEMVGEHFARFVHPDDLPVLQASLERSLAGNFESFDEFRLVTRAGHTRYVRATSYPLTENGRIVGLVGVVADITEKKLADDALREGEARYRCLFENSPISLWEEDFSEIKDRLELLRGQGVTDFRAFFESHAEEVLRCVAKVRIHDVNQVTLSLYECASKDQLQDGLARCFDERTLPALRESILAIAEGRTRFHAETVQRTYAGNPIHVEVSWAVAPGYESTYGRVLVSVIDVTDRHRAEDARKRLAMAVEQSAEAIVIADADANIIYANPAFERITGYRQAEVLGKNPRILKSGRQDEAFYHQLWSTLTGKKVWHGHFVNQKKDGTLYEEDAVISPVRDAGGTIVSYVAVKRDVTHQMEMEARLRRLQKVEAMGLMAARIAHEINNPLAGIKNSFLLIKDAVPTDHPDYEFVHRIEAEIDRLARIVRQMFDIYRPQKVEAVDFDPQVAVKDVVMLLQNEAQGGAVEIGTAFSSLPGTVRLSRDFLIQILYNIVRNAISASPPNGRVLVSASAADNLLRIRVADQGKGIPASARPNLFEPFFTTGQKAGAGGSVSGMGLGLFISRCLAQSMGGDLDCDSAEGGETVFTVTLPLNRIENDQVVTLPINRIENNQKESHDGSSGKNPAQRR